MARGLTLIEVLAATVLLTLLATACVGLVRDARRLTDPFVTSNPETEVRLAWLAELVSADPESFGIEVTTSGPRVRSGAVTLPEDMPTWIGNVRWVLRTADAPDDVRHGWLELRLDEASAWTAVILMPDGDTPEDER